MRSFTRSKAFKALQDMDSAARLIRIVIDHMSGKAYASQKALARLIDKDEIYVRNHEKALSKGGKEIDKITAEIHTPGGLQGGKLYGETFIYSLLAEHKPDLLVRNHEESMVRNGVKIDKISAEIRTSQGLRTASLFGEDFIYSLPPVQGCRGTVR